MVKNIDVKSKPTPEQIQMLENAKSFTVSRDDEYPEFTKEELSKFKKISEEKKVDSHKQVVTLRLSGKTLKKAKSLAVLKDGKLAIQVGVEVTEYEPMKDVKVPNIATVREGLDYETYTEAFPSINFAENVVWKMLKTPAGQECYKKYFKFENGEVIVEAYPNENSKLVLEILELEKDRTSLVTDLDCKYLDLWFKWTKNSKFDLALGKNSNCAVKFSKNNIGYIVMPLTMIR